MRIVHVCRKISFGTILKMIMDHMGDFLSDKTFLQSAQWILMTGVSPEVDNVAKELIIKKGWGRGAKEINDIYDVPDGVTANLFNSTIFNKFGKHECNVVDLDDQQSDNPPPKNQQPTTSNQATEAHNPNKQTATEQPHSPSWRCSTQQTRNVHWAKKRSTSHELDDELTKSVKRDSDASPRMSRSQSPEILNSDTDQEMHSTEQLSPEKKVGSVKLNRKRSLSTAPDKLFQKTFKHEQHSSPRVSISPSPEEHEKNVPKPEPRALVLIASSDPGAMVEPGVRLCARMFVVPFLNIFCPFCHLVTCEIVILL